MTEIVEAIIYPKLKRAGYHLRKAPDREAWYITSRETGTIYVLAHHMDWHVSEVSGSPSEAEILQKEIRETIQLAEQIGGTHADQ